MICCHCTEVSVRFIDVKLRTYPSCVVAVQTPTQLAVFITAAFSMQQNAASTAAQGLLLLSSCGLHDLRSCLVFTLKCEGTCKHK